MQDRYNKLATASFQPTFKQPKVLKNNELTNQLFDVTF